PDPAATELPSAPPTDAPAGTDQPSLPDVPADTQDAVPAAPDGSGGVEDPAAPGGGTPMLGEQRVPVSLDLVPVVADVDGVDQAVPDLLGTVVLIGADGQAVINGQAPSLGSALRENDPSGTLLAGRAPRDASEIAL